MITSKPSLNDAILDLAGLVPNPPHPTFKSSEALEWAGRAIGEAFYNKVLSAVTSLARFAAQTFKTSPKLNIPTPILTFQRYDYF